MRRIDTPELLDSGGHSPALLAENLADMARATRWFGGVWLLHRALTVLLRDQPPRASLTLLDVGCGGGVVGATAAAWALRRGHAVTLIGMDHSPPIVRLAAGRPGLRPLVADGRTIPLPDGAVDLALCSFTLHHLTPPDALTLLRELGRVARRGVIVDDLLRSSAGYAGAWLFSHTLSANPLTRHDGPLSVRRAYTRRELLTCGLASRSVHRPGVTLGYRAALALHAGRSSTRLRAQSPLRRAAAWQARRFVGRA